MKSVAACSVLLALLVGAALLGAMPASAQDAILEDERLSSVRTALATDLETARREGFPDEWLRDKIAEGLSKHIPPPRIASAVHVLLGRIRTGDRLLASIPRAQRPLRQSVDALGAGAPEAALGQLVRAVLADGDAGSVRAALVTVAELSEREFDGNAAVLATMDAYRRGGRGAMQALVRDARRIDRSTHSRNDALRRLGNGVDRGRGGRDHDIDVHPGRGHR